MDIFEWLDKNQDEDNILPPSMDAQTAMNFLWDYLFENECICYPCSTGQFNTEAVFAILEKYSKRFKREWRKRKKERQNESRQKFT